MYSQIIKIDSTKLLVLHFDWAAKEGSPFADTQQCKVYWNKVLILSVNPADYQIHHSMVEIIAINGDNLIEFAASGKSDSIGIVIDNIYLTDNLISASRNFIVNGYFENPVFPDSFKILPSI